MYLHIGFHLLELFLLPALKESQMYKDKQLEKDFPVWKTELKKRVLLCAEYQY